MANSYIYDPAASGTEFDYSALSLLADNIEPHENQIRVFVDKVELSGDDLSIDPEGFTLTVPVLAGAELLIIRQTRWDRPLVSFTNVGRFTAQNLNTYRDQILYIAQEINEEGELFELLEEIAPVLYKDDSNYSDEFDTSTADTFEYTFDVLPDIRFPHALQIAVYKNGELLEYDTDYTVDAADNEVVLDTALITSDTLKIVRQSQLTPVTTDFRNATPLASGIIDIMFQHIQYVIEELPYFIGLDGHTLRNRRFPRRINFLRYSGPGDRFHWHGLPWNPDATVTVYVNDIPLVEDEDYTISLPDWSIFFPTPLEEDDIVVITINFPDDEFPARPLDDASEEQDELASASGTAPSVLLPVTVDSNRDLVAETDNPTAPIVSINPDEVDFKAVFEWNIPEFRGKDLAVTKIGFRAYESLDPGSEYTTTYKIYAVGPDYSTSTEGVTSVEGTFTEEDSWVKTEDIGDFLAEALTRNSGRLYLVFTADSINGLPVNSREHEPDNEDYMCARLSINGAEFPGGLAPMSGFVCSQFRAGTMGALTLNIDFTFADVQDGQLPFLSAWNYGAGSGGSYTHNHDILAVLMVAEGLLTITGTGEVSSGTGGALTLLEAVPDMGFTSWTRSGIGLASDSDLDLLTSAGGVVPFEVTYTVQAGDVGKYLYLEWNKSGAPATSQQLTIETITLE